MLSKNKRASPRLLQMRDVEMPLRAVGDEHIAVWPVTVGDLVDVHVRRKYVENDGIA
jgi:hypothetical protein